MYFVHRHDDDDDDDDDNDDETGVPEPGRGRAGHVVQLGAVPVLGVRLARRGQRGPQGLLPDHPARDGHGYPVLLGREDGER